MEGAKASGCRFGSVEVSTSEQFQELEELHPPRMLPRFSWLIIDGMAGRDDVGVSSNGSLVVSERLLQTMRPGRLEHCDISPATVRPTA